MLQSKHQVIYIYSILYYAYGNVSALLHRELNPEPALTSALCKALAGASCISNFTTNHCVHTLTQKLLSFEIKLEEKQFFLKMMLSVNPQTPKSSFQLSLMNLRWE